MIQRDLDFYSAQLQYCHEYISKLRYNTAARAFPQNGFDCLKARFLHKKSSKTIEDRTLRFRQSL